MKCRYCSVLRHLINRNSEQKYLKYQNILNNLVRSKRPKKKVNTMGKERSDTGTLGVGADPTDMAFEFVAI